MRPKLARNLWPVLVLAVGLLFTLPILVRGQSDDPAADTVITRVFLPLVQMDERSNATTIIDENGDLLEALALTDEGTAEWAALEAFDTPLVEASALVIEAAGGTEDAKGLGYPDSRKIVRDAKNNLYLTYRKKFGTKGCYHIFVARRGAAKSDSWSLLNNGQPIDTIGSGSDYQQRVPSLTIDNSNVLHITWYGLDHNITTSCDGENNNRQIYYLRAAPPYTSWVAANVGVELAPVPGWVNSTLWQEHPVIYAAQGNWLYIAWEGRDAQNDKQQIKFLRSSDGGRTWTPPTAATNYNLPVNPTDPFYSAAFSRPTVIASYNDGKKLYLFARATKNGVAQIVWVRSNNGGATWTPWEAIAACASQPCDQRHVTAAVDVSGSVHVAWRERTGETVATAIYRIRYVRYGSNQWQGHVLLPPATATAQQTFASISVDDYKRPWLVWSETPYTATTSSLSQLDKEIDELIIGKVYYRWHSGTTWTAPSALSANDSIPALYPSLRHQRYHSRARIDAIWLELNVNQCNEISAPYCIHFLNLSK